MSTLIVNNLNLHTLSSWARVLGPCPVESKRVRPASSQIETRALAPQQSRVKRYQTDSTFELSTRLSETGPIKRLARVGGSKEPIGKAVANSSVLNLTSTEMLAAR